VRERFARLLHSIRPTGQELAEEVEAELAFHLDMRAADLMGTGLDEASARRRAREEFGDLEFTRAYCLRLDQRQERAGRLADWIGEWGDDLRQVGRTIRHSPGFALMSLLTLALAIGANTAIFSVVQAVLLRPLPYSDPGRLVTLAETQPDHPEALDPTISGLNFLDYRAGQQVLTGIAAYDRRSVTWRPANGDPELLEVQSITGNAFELLGVRPLLGRSLTEQDGLPGTEPRTVLAWGFWQRAFGGDPGVVGRTMTLNDLPYLVVGVMPRGFTIDGSETMWAPLNFKWEQANPAATRRQHVFRTIARLAPGVTLAAANAALAGVSRDLEAQYPDANTGRVAVLTPLHAALTESIRPSLWLLQAASGLLLLIACVNLANLSLARGLARRREMALRAALGAGRPRLVRQLLTESVGLAITGGVVGIGIALVLTRLLLALEPAAVPQLFPVGPDRAVLGFGLALSVLTGLAFGILPAWEAARPDLRVALQDGGRGVSAGSGGMRRALVVAQVALAVVLLAGTGLMLRSFATLLRVPLGFDPDHVLTAEVRVSGERYDPPAAVNDFYDRVLADIGAQPGVVAVGAAIKLPTRGLMTSSLTIDGARNDPNRLPAVGLVLVRGDYFKVLHVPLKAGRLFGPEDRADAPGVVLLNQAAARTFFPGQDPVGRRIRLGPFSEAPWSTVIGVVGDLREENLEDQPGPVAYGNHVQNTWWRSLVLTVRTKGDPVRAEPFIRAAVRRTDPTLAVRNVETLEAAVGDNLRVRRLALALVGSFAVVALLLAAVGIYGVLAFTVSSRVREFGVRLALGAERRSVLLLVLRQGLGWATLGLGLGLLGTFAAGRLLEGRLYGVTPTDTLTLTLTAAGLLLVAGLACLAPAARATRVDPIRSLRAE
jgi:putative ABC transport system permease protein